MGEEYARFVEELVRRGNGERIWRGESPFAEPASAEAPPAS